MVEGYQFRVYLREISPAIWRRLLLRDDQTIADLHYTLQITMGWSDYHLNRFIIHGKQFGVYHIGGMSFSDDPHEVYLRDFRFRPRERFLYEYDFGDLWQHEIRLERKLPLDPNKALFREMWSTSPTSSANWQVRDIRSRRRWFLDSART